jgi:AcrR family transcriptional regulator
MRALKNSRQPKSAETRTKILDAALELFREKGFAETSMREVAAKAGVATGLAYYYFESKEALVLAFYQRSGDELEPRLGAVQTGGSSLAERLHALIATKLEYFAPNRRFLGALMAHAADPHNPMSPFAAPSAAIREMGYQQFQRALHDTGTSVPGDLQAQLPRMLWMFQMGIILFWIYDRSEGQQRTRRLLDASLRLVTALIGVAAMPFLGPARKLVLNVIDAIEN